MRKFNTIKKSRKKSKDIDEKIEYLDKECQKTGLQEFMTTSNIYQGSTKVPNQEYSAFQALNVNGYGLALSGADGNSIGGASVEDHLGAVGVALSPPHPVTGVRHQALHVRDGLGGTTPLRPGAVIKRGFADNAPDYTMGSAIWFYFPTHNNGEGVPPGKWCNFEYGNFENNSGWGFWDTIKTGQFAGLHVFNRTTSEHPCGDIDLATKIASINFGENGTVGAPQTTVLTQKDLGDPGHLPINLKDFSKQAFDYLKGKAQDFFGTIGDALKGSTDSYYKGSLTPRDSAFKKLKDFFADINPFTFNPDFEWATELALSVIANKPVVRTGNDVSKSDIDKLYKNVNPDNVIIGDLNTVIADGNVYLDDKDGKIKSNHINPNLPDGDDVGQRQHSDNLIHPNLSNDIGKPKYSFTNPLASEGQGTIIYDPTTGASRYVNFTYYNTSTTDKGSEDPLELGDKFVNFLGMLGIDRKRDSEHTGDMTGIPKNILGMKLTDVKSNKSNLPNSFIKKMNSKVSGSLGESKDKSVSESLNEAAKLGHFDPQVLNVDINNIRKGIMPEFPKDPPPEMINGYSAKSKLAPKKVELPPFIKVTRKDLAQNHKLTDKEIQDFLDDVNKINEYIKNNPADLKYAMIRYPKDDPRLAQLNWQMDQMKAASEEYMETHFPENQKLFSKLQDKIIRNIKQTDPKNYTGHKEAPKFTDDNIEMSEQRKKIMLKHFKKPVKIKKLFKH